MNGDGTTSIDSAMLFIATSAGESSLASEINNYGVTELALATDKREEEKLKSKNHILLLQDLTVNHVEAADSSKTESISLWGKKAHMSVFSV